MEKIWITLIVVLTLGLYWLLPTTPITNPQSVETLSGNFMLTNVRIFDGEQSIEKGSVVVTEHQIVFIGEGDISAYSALPLLDGAEHTLLPGLVDAHTHSWGDAPRDALNFGVATALDMFTVPSFMQTHLPVRDSLSNTQQADLFSPMYLATAPHGHGTQFGMQVPALENVDQVAQFVADRVAEGADYIKAVYFSEHSPNQHFPSISLEILQALAEQAEQYELKLLVHIDDLVSAKEAIKVGADGLVHIFTDKLADQEIIDLMTANDVFVVPTLSIIARAAHVDDGVNVAHSEEIKKHLRGNQLTELQQVFPEFGLTSAHYEIAETNVKLLHDAGITVLAGSDAPNPGTTHGASLHEELQRFVEVGLTPAQALKAATGAARNVLPIGNRGHFSVAAPATMVLVKGNPLSDIQATQAIVTIWKHGQPLKRYTAENKEQINNPVVGGFNFDFSSDETTLNQRFFVTTDKMMQGNSTGELLFKVESQPGHLAFNGEIKPGFMYPWAGIAIALGSAPNQPVNISGTSQLTLSARMVGTPATLTILLIQEGIRQPFMLPVTIGGEWQQHQIDLSQIPGVDLTKVVNLSLAFMREPGQYNLQLDSIRLH